MHQHALAALSGGGFPGRDPWLASEQAAAGAAAHAAAAAAAATAGPPAACGAEPQGSTTASGLLSVVVSHIKLHDISPYELPRELSDLVRTWLGPHVLDALAYVRPGCTLITLHALVAADEHGVAQPRGTAAQLAAALVAGVPARVARSRFSVHDAAGGVARAQGGVVADAGTAAALSAPLGASPLASLRPMALCSTHACALAATAPAAAAGQLRAYVSGALLQLPADACSVAAGQPVQLRLPASGCVLLAACALRAACLLLCKRSSALTHASCAPRAWQSQAGGRCVV